MEIKIDPKLPIRGVPFESLVTLLAAVKPYLPIRYIDAQKLVTQERVIVSVRKPGESLKNSSFYHYWNALKLLGFIDQREKKLHYISERGERLLLCRTVGDSLTPKMQAVFREGMLSSQEIWDNFFVLFTCERSPIQTPQIGNIVSFKPLVSQKYRRYEIQTICSDKPIIVDDARVYQLIISGLRRWGEQCGLVDEIFPPITSRKFSGVSSFMYLLDPMKNEKMNSDVFTDIIRRYQDHAEVILETTLRFDIPDFTAHVCSQEGISLEKFQIVFLEWINQNRRDVALERPSIGLVEEQRGMRNSLSIRRSQPWLIKNEFIYTTLLVRKQLLDQG